MRAIDPYCFVEKVKAASRRKGSNYAPTTSKGKGPDISGPFSFTFSTHAPCVFALIVPCPVTCILRTEKGHWTTLAQQAPNLPADFLFLKFRL